MRSPSGGAPSSSEGARMSPSGSPTQRRFAKLRNMNALVWGALAAIVLSGLVAGGLIHARQVAPTLGHPDRIEQFRIAPISDDRIVVDFVLEQDGTKVSVPDGRLEVRLYPWDGTRAFEPGTRLETRMGPAHFKTDPDGATRFEAIFPFNLKAALAPGVSAL